MVIDLAKEGKLNIGAFPSMLDQIHFDLNAILAICPQSPGATARINDRIEAMREVLRQEFGLPIPVVGEDKEVA